MCTNGVNTSQLQTTIDMINDEIALVRRWTHKTYHLADDGGMTRTAKQLEKVQGLLDQVRSELDETNDCLERDDMELGDTTVTLV